MAVLQVEICLSPIAYETILMGDSAMLQKIERSLLASTATAPAFVLERNLEIVLAENVAKLRAQQGMTQAELSDLCGLHRNELYRIENSTVSISLHTLEKLARGLKIHPSELIK